MNISRTLVKAYCKLGWEGAGNASNVPSTANSTSLFRAGSVPKNGSDYLLYSVRSSTPETSPAQVKTPYLTTAGVSMEVAMNNS